MKKKRVLIVTSGGLDRSGVPSVIMTAVRGLRDECVFDIMLSNPEENDLLKEFRKGGGKVFPYVKRHFRLGLMNALGDFLRPVSLYFRTKQVIAENGPYDILHCFNEFDMAGSIAAAAAGGVPVRVAHVHKTWMNRGGPLTRLYRWYCRRMINRHATARLGCSRLACDCFYHSGEQTQVISNPYDGQRFRWNPAVTMNSSTIRLIQIGYLCDNKNQHFTLEVFRSIAACQPDASLTFVGTDSGLYGDILKADICKSGLDDRVMFLPPDADIPALLNTNTLLLLPSKTEGFGMVLIEAQAMGLWCYASDTVPKETDLGGVRFLPLSDGPESWAKTILRERLFEQKIPRDCSAFSIESFCRNIRRIYGIDKSDTE